MNELLDWLSMGGYFSYVWTAYGLVIITLAAAFFSVKRKRKRTQIKLQQWFKG